MTARPGLAAALAAGLALAAAPGAGAQGYQIEGAVYERGVATPSFPAPTVVIRVVRDLRHPDGGVDLERLAEVELEDGAYKFEEYLGDRSLSNRIAVFTAEAGDYMMPGLKYVQLEDGMAGRRSIEVTLELQKRGVLAEAYRREVFGILREDRPGREGYRRAVNAALSAVEYDPKLDNYLLAVKASRVALHEGQIDDPTLILSLDDLRAMSGFSALGFAEQWRVESELLDMLASAPDLSAQVSFGDTFATAAVALADAMLAQLDPADPALRELPVTRVFNALTRLHARNGDCPSLVAASARALDLAPALAMNWASQRRFLVDWGDCLERMSGVADGRPARDFAADARAQPGLAGLWRDYGAALRRAETGFLHPATEEDRRLKRFLELASLIEGGTDGD